MWDVAVVIVTRNRKDLLLDCLAAVRDQDIPPSRIYLVDNASQDGTREALAASGWNQGNLHLVPSKVNMGGAGGFHCGMRLAYERGHQWIWIMDDDCLPRPDALRQLLQGFTAFPDNLAPTLLSSRVEWTDGRVHPMNVVAVDARDKEFLYAAAQRGTLSIRAATFVSLLANRRAIADIGLPNARYFLWLDDVEWTARVLRKGRGVLVPSSIVIHRTSQPVSTLDAPPGRFFFFVRNSMWMLLGSRSFGPIEKLHRGMVMLYVIMRWSAKRCWRPTTWITLIHAGIRGLFPPISNKGSSQGGIDSGQDGAAVPTQASPPASQHR